MIQLGVSYLIILVLTYKTLSWMLGARVNQSLSPKQHGKKSEIGSIAQSNLQAPLLHTIPEIMNYLDIINITKIKRLSDSVITMKMS